MAGEAGVRRAIALSPTGGIVPNGPRRPSARLGLIRITLFRLQLRVSGQPLSATTARVGDEFSLDRPGRRPAMRRS